MIVQSQQTGGLLAPLTAPKPPPAPPRDVPDWRFDGGTAWVYHGAGHNALARPVILSDGFSPGASNVDVLWDGLENGAFPFASTLLNSGRDLVILGYDDRTASILDNAEVATACIQRANRELRGDAALVVGGFSMGGLVTRYALARMEHDGIDHRTWSYLSYDSPHRGAWIPISLQSLAHFLERFPAMSDQINSPAARQLLWRHVAEVGAEPVEDPARTAFLAELRRVGWWPRRPRKIGVANGRGDGVGNGLPAGAEALRVTGALSALKDTALYVQAAGDERRVASLRRRLTNPAEIDVLTAGFAEIDAAPGGTLDTFGIAADNLSLLGETVCPHRDVCFVPTVSAVAVGDLDSRESLYANVVDGLPPGTSELDEFRCASGNEAHTVITEELCRWILDRLPG